jgi:hypothetical protein
MMLFGPSAYDAETPQANPARLLNCYREPGQRTLIRPAQGLSVWTDTGNVLAGDMMTIDGTPYAIFGDELLSLPGLTLATLATGEQFLSRNGSAVTAVSGGRYFVWDGSLEEPGGLFGSYGSVTYLAGRTVITEGNGNRFQWSDIDAPTTLNGLNFASAEQRDDKLLRAMAVSGVLMLFGEQSTEIWAVTGQAGAAAFQLLPGAVVDIGLKARKLAVDVGGAVFLVGDDGIAYLAASTQWQPVSIPAVHTALLEGTPRACVYWEDRGHKFAAIVFQDRPAWVYDLATKEWWERADGDRWNVEATSRYGDGWLFGGIDGKVYQPGGDVIATATSGLIEQDGYFTINEVEFGISHGFQTAVASLLLETSRDGATWSRVASVDLGQDGDFQRRAVFRRIGRSRKRAFRATWGGGIALYADAKVK